MNGSSVLSVYSLADEGSDTASSCHGVESRNPEGDGLEPRSGADGLKSLQSANTSRSMPTALNGLNTLSCLISRFAVRERGQQS